MKAQLNDMEKRGVIRKVEEPTNWVNSMAIVEKPDGSLRICLDPRHLNKAIKREHFQLPTIEDITTRMANAKWFTKLDANRGYWQIPLDEESQLLTTFTTPFGRFCYQVAPFGIKYAQQVFQKPMSQHFGDLLSMLSRAPLPETTDMNNVQEEISLQIHLIQSNLAVSKPKLEEIREETAKDESLKDLIEIIKRGWPETKACVSNSTRMYWDVRDELSELNGIILRGERILIPTSMPKEMLERIHQGHMGIEKSRRRA